MSNIIEVKRVSKNFKVLKKKPGLRNSLGNFFSRDYNIVKAVSNVSLNVEEGEFLGVIGPNGAGKSTLIKILTGVLTPDTGSVKVMGLVPYKQRIEYAKDIGVVFGHKTQLWWDLPPKDTFELSKHIYKIPEERFRKNLSNFIEVIGIEKYLDTPVRKLSLGERMRCDLVASLLHEPRIAFLDEPTIGLDVEAKFRIREFLKELNEKGTTIILTTHDMSDIEELCPRIAIIDKGKKIYDGSVDNIKKKFRKERILIIDFMKGVDKKKLKMKGVKSVKIDGDRVTMVIDTSKITCSNIIKKILNKWPIYDITIDELPIEEIIRKIYKRGFDVS